MPKLPMDYSKTIIYKIKHIDNDSLVYVGHTTNWEQRKYRHKSVCYNEKGKAYNLKVYQVIRENGGWNAFKMIEVQKYPCEGRREAEKRECEVMKELKSSMNTYRSYITEEEKQEMVKEYKETNKERISERKKRYYENNKDKNKEQTKEYYENNKDIINQKHEEYRNKNKEKSMKNEEWNIKRKKKKENSVKEK